MRRLLVLFALLAVLVPAVALSGNTAMDGSLAVRDGRAEVTATDAPPSVKLAADTLGALYLGGVDVRTLAAAGRITGARDAIETWAAMADGGPRPYCITGF